MTGQGWLAGVIDLPPAGAAAWPHVPLICRLRQPVCAAWWAERLKVVARAGKL